MRSKEMILSIVNLANGERIGLNAVEITAVPHLSTLQKRFSADISIDTEYKHDMARLLRSEIYQYNKNNQSIRAVVKSERLENLQNNILPSCFAFDTIPKTENDMSRIVSSLINYPDCAVSFQLMPVIYSPDEELSDFRKLSKHRVVHQENRADEA